MLHGGFVDMGLFCLCSWLTCLIRFREEGSKTGAFQNWQVVHLLRIQITVPKLLRVHLPTQDHVKVPIVRIGFWGANYATIIIRNPPK